MHLADAFIQSNLQCIQAIIIFFVSNNMKYYVNLLLLTFYITYLFSHNSDFSRKCKFISPSSDFLTQFNSTIASLSILSSKARSQGYKLMILSRGEKKGELFFLLRIDI